MKLFRIVTAAALAAAAPAFAAELSVTQKNQTFSSPNLTAHVGDTLTFHNEDDVTHNITVKDKDGDPDDLGLQKPGKTVNYKFEAAGSYRVMCSIHPKMKMIVTVQ